MPRQCLIQTDTTPVACRGEALHEVWWRGRQWAVTAYGVECLDGTYSFKADRLLEDLPAYSWCEHMAEKEWVDIDDFATAWLVALSLHGVRADPEVIRAALARLPLERETP